MLAALTLAFLGVLVGLTLYGERPDGQERYSITTERTVPPDEEARLDLNTATAEELEQLRGIGPSLAEAIVRYRSEYGPFSSVEELTEVSGIGPAKLDSVRDQLTVESEFGNESGGAS